MAIVNIAFGKPTAAGEHVGVMLMRYNATVENVSSSGTSAASVATSAAGDACTVLLDARATAPIYVAFGTSPTALAAGGAGNFLCVPGVPRDFAGFPAGVRAAVIDAT